MIMGFILQRTSYPIMYACLTLIGVTNFLYFYYALGRKGKNSHKMMDGAPQEGISESSSAR
jgi:hypothetical protein